MNFGGGDGARRLEGHLGLGQGIGVIDRVVPAAALVDRLESGVPAARAALL